MRQLSIRTVAFALIGVAAYPVCAATLVVVDPAAMVDSRAASSVAIGTDGLPRLAYANAAAGALRFARCSALDCSEATLETIDGARGFDSSMGLAVSGNPIVAYYESQLDRLRLAACVSADCAGIEILRTIDDPADDVGQYASLAVDAAGRPVIAYFNSSNDSLRLAACLDVDCTNASITTIDDDPAIFVGEYVDLALGADGFPVLAYVVLPTGVLTVAKCFDATCAGSPAIHAVDDAPGGASVGRYASIAIGADGNPIISYQDFGNEALKVAKCIDSACAGPATISTLDDRGEDAGAYTAIAIRPDGTPIISYQRGLADADDSYVLEVAECLSADCAGGVERHTLDSRLGEIIGWHTELAIGSDGGAVISYYNSTANTFNVAKCSARTCEGPGDRILFDGFDRIVRRPE